jgi:hypothetical protein
MRILNRRWVFAVVVALLSVACGDSAPDADGLRDAFVAQFQANTFVSDVRRDGDEVTFSGPTAEGGSSTWRIQIESAVVEPNDDPDLPYRGTVVSSWYADGQLVQPAGRESNLPVELTSNGLAQDCYALWNGASWGWE